MDGILGTHIGCWVRQWDLLDPWQEALAGEIGYMPRAWCLIEHLTGGRLVAHSRTNVILLLLRL